MDITTKITIRHMKMNKKRTGAAIFTVALSACLIMVVSIFMFSLFDIMIRTEIRQHGAYHARFHNLSGKQMDKLGNEPEVASCKISEDTDEHTEPDLHCADVVLKTPGPDVYALTQELAAKIQMKPLPADHVTGLPDETQCIYEVTYHDELLKFYGAKTESESNAAIPLTTAAGSILLIIVLLSCILIYHSFSISTTEKLRYLGMLGSVGATKKQKRNCVIKEGMIIGILGIPMGLSLGIAVMYLIFRLFSDKLMKFAGSDLPMYFVMNPYIIIITVVCSMITILAACMIPAYRAGKISVMESLIHTANTRSADKTCFRSFYFSKKCSMETALAIKNMWYHKKRYGAILFAMISSMALFFNVTIYIQYNNGDYMLGQDRDYAKDRPIRIMLNTDDDQKVSSFYQALKEQKEIENISYTGTIDLWAFIPLAYINSKVQSGKTIESGKLPHTVYHENGTTEKGICLSLYVQGLDDVTFAAYLKKAKLDDTGITGEYPVIVEDTALLRIGTKDQLGGLLSLDKSAEFKVWFDKHKNPYFYVSSSMHPLSLEPLTFQPIGVTDSPPPVNGFLPGDNVTFISVYMPITNFRRFIEEPVIKETQDASKKYAKEQGYEIPAISSEGFSIELKRKKSSAEKLAGLLGLDSSKYARERAKEDSAFLKKVEQLSAACGLTPTKPGEITYHSFHTEENETVSVVVNPEDMRDTYSFESTWIWYVESGSDQDPSTYLMQIFNFGLVALVALICLISILNSISSSIRLRSREFPILQSMGMTRQAVRRMVWMESAIYGLAALILGIPVSLVIMWFMTASIKADHYLDIVIPYHILGFEILAVVFITFVSVIYAARQMKHMNIIDSIRDENL